MGRWYERLFNLLLVLIYALYTAVLLVGWNRAPYYLAQINLITQVFVGLLLIWFFNPLQTYKYDKFHKTLGFTAGFFLISATIMTKLMEYLQQILKPVRSNISKQLESM